MDSYFEGSTAIVGAFCEQFRRGPAAGSDVELTRLMSEVLCLLTIQEADWRAYPQVHILLWTYALSGCMPRLSFQEHAI